MLPLAVIYGNKRAKVDAFYGSALGVVSVGFSDRQDQHRQNWRELETGAQKWWIGWRLKSRAFLRQTGVTVMSVTNTRDPGLGTVCFPSGLHENGNCTSTSKSFSRSLDIFD